MLVGPETSQADINSYSAVVLPSVPEIQSLLSRVRTSLPHTDALLDPEFSLAGISPGWAPRVAAVQRGSDFAGLVIAKERTLCGLRLGVAYADLTFGSTLLGNKTEQRDAFLIAMKALLAFRGVHGLRLRVQPHSFEMEVVRKLLSSSRLDVHFSRVKDHARLLLPGTYEELLLSFGSTTRHNFRYYRRRFEAAGHVFLEIPTLDELRSAALDLASRCTLSSSPESIERILKMVSIAERPLAVGLKHRNGEWLSIIGGVYRPSAAVLLLQANRDLDFPRDSLSVVLRGYLLESLIRQGMKSLIIWAGTGRPLSRYVSYIPTVGVYLDSPEYKWRVARGLISKFGPFLPKRLKPDARWIASFS